MFIHASKQRVCVGVAGPDMCPSRAGATAGCVVCVSLSRQFLEILSGFLVGNFHARAYAVENQDNRCYICHIRAQMKNERISCLGSTKQRYNSTRES